MKANLGMTLGQRRRTLGIPAEEIARSLDVSVSTIYAWESGSKSPSVTHAVKFAALVQRRVIAWSGKQNAAQGLNICDVMRLRHAAGVTRDELAERLGIKLPSVRATELRIHEGSPVATVVRYLTASGYRIGLAATARSPLVGHAGAGTLTQFIALDAHGFSNRHIRAELNLSRRQVQRYAATARAKRKQLQEATR